MSYLQHHIDSSSDGALTDYQIAVIVNRGSGANSGDSCYINCAPDFSDVEFKNADGSTLLSFWKETPVTATTAKFWAKIPSIPASGGVDIRLYYTGIATTSTQDGAATFPNLFDDFINSNVRSTHIAMDTAQAGGFDPVSRRIYNLSGENGDGTALKLGQWLNIDKNETGIIWPGHPLGLQGQAVIYHPPSGKFYLYGGYNGYSNTPYSNAICTYDPATDTWATLTEVMTAALGGTHQAIYDATTNKVYIFGGSTAIVSSPRTYTNVIQVHDLTAGTVTNTGAVLAQPSWGHAPQQHGNYVYLFGGAGVSASANVSYNAIYRYNLASPASNPVLVSTATLSQRRDTAMTAKIGNSVYIFGGYDYNTATYWKTIDKFDLVAETLTTLSTTMFYEDDDALCFYDAVTDRIFIGPVRHSSTVAHADDKKRVFIEFNPNTETFAAEPTLPTVPAGWASNGTSTTDTLDAIDGSYMSLADNSATTYLRAQKDIGATLTGKFYMEFGLSVWGKTVNNTSPAPLTQIRIKKTGSDFNLDPLITLRAGKSTATKVDNFWTVEAPTGTQTTIAAIPKGQHVVSAKIDTSAQTVVSSVNRGAGVSKAYQNAGAACQQIWINTPAANVEGALIDWVLVRKWTANEPAHGAWTGGSTSIDLSGAAIATATATGVLNQALALSGSAAAITTASGNVDLTVSLTGSALAQAIGSADFGGANSNLAGQANAQTTASGNINLSLTFAGIALAQSLANANLTVSGANGLSGNAQSISSATGSLGLIVPLLGNSSAVALAIGNISTSLPITGSAVSIANGSGNMTLTVSFSENVIDNVLASGSLLLNTTLSGSALVSALASAMLNNGANDYSIPVGKLLLKDITDHYLLLAA